MRPAVAQVPGEKQASYAASLGSGEDIGRRWGDCTTPAEVCCVQHSGNLRVGVIERREQPVDECVSDTQGEPGEQLRRLWRSRRKLREAGVIQVPEHKVLRVRRPRFLGRGVAARVRR